MEIKNIFKGGKKKIWLLAALGIAGVLLVLLGSSGYLSDKKENISDTDLRTEEYTEVIENKIRNITERITGSDSAGVIVSVKQGVEYVYVSNEEVDGDKRQLDYITSKNADGSYGLVLVKEIYPEITGVSVACRGGDDAEIRMKLVNAVSTALGIPSNRICIVGTK